MASLAGAAEVLPEDRGRFVAVGDGRTRRNRVKDRRTGWQYEEKPRESLGWRSTVPRLSSCLARIPVDAVGELFDRRP
jgi:hypothetical protein